MAEKNPCTHRAYALKREGQQVRWLEIGVASISADNHAIDIYIDRLPVGGFNGYIRIAPNETPPDDPSVLRHGTSDDHES